MRHFRGLPRLLSAPRPRIPNIPHEWILQYSRDENRMAIDDGSDRRILTTCYYRQSLHQGDVRRIRGGTHDEKGSG